MFVQPDNSVSYAVHAVFYSHQSVHLVQWQRLAAAWLEIVAVAPRDSVPSDCNNTVVALAAGKDPAVCGLLLCSCVALQRHPQQSPAVEREYYRVCVQHTNIVAASERLLGLHLLQLHDACLRTFRRLLVSLERSYLLAVYVSKLELDLSFCSFTDDGTEQSLVYPNDSNRLRPTEHKCVLVELLQHEHRLVHLDAVQKTEFVVYYRIEMDMAGRVAHHKLFGISR